jgi:hypothetical protein
MLRMTCLVACTVLSVLQTQGLQAQQTQSDGAGRHWTLSALGGVSSLALGGGGAAEVWSRVGPVRGGEGLLGAAAYGGQRWGIEAAYGSGHGSLAEFTASTLTLALMMQRQLGFVSSRRWDTRAGLGFVRSVVSVPSIPFDRFQLRASEISGLPVQPFEASGDEFLLANGLRAELSVTRASAGRVRLNGRAGIDISSMEGTTSRTEVPLLTQHGRMTSVYLRFGVAVRR